ncbi:MAG: single-stranded-DNA-specific exonuclease RecJ, partial [candidate division KSB1 bacterium]|nr:single-stranded-DNA-specific exonuclease RecJ [candidate division KSB1 bacterium]
EQKQRILVYGDYDVDGATATAMMILFFRQLGIEVDFYIPHRIREGYGLSKEAIEAIHGKGVDLIIAVDCGITAIEEVALARKLGMDVIVCDHHQPGKALPEAHAILNPKRADCPYPFKELAGVGVAFKLAQALAQRFSHPENALFQLLDLVAIGSAADIVPLVDENRILVREGLEMLQRTQNIGLRALLKKTGLEGKAIGTGQIIFILAPRINAVGRMSDASQAVRLLTTYHEQEALNIAELLEKENRNRRNIDEETFKEAIEQVEAYFDPEKDPVLVLSSEGWHPGVIGIVASRVVERYYRPTVMISTDDGIGKGSARSIPGFNIYDALKTCSDLMLAFGGHKYAAGLSIASENIARLRERLQEYADGVLTDELLTPKLSIEGELDFEQIDGKLMRILKMLAPYGPQNMRPVFYSKNIRVVGTPAIVGSNHLRFKACQNGKVIDAIGFNLGGLLHRIRGNRTDIEIAYLLEENEWQGRVYTQLRIKDIR